MFLQRDYFRILDILECINRIEVYSEKMDFELFKNDVKTQDAVIRNLEIIGEASKSLTEDFKNRNNKIAWAEMSKLRDKLIHHYTGINIDIIWEIIVSDIPKLKSDIQSILE